MARRVHPPGEAFRYSANARGIVKDIAVEDNFYVDVKPVREAFSTAYLAILEAIDEALLKKAFTAKELPKSVDGYREAMEKYLSVHNGKVLNDFERLYRSIHIAGYYRGLITEADMVNGAFKATEQFIKKVIGEPPL